MLSSFLIVAQLLTATPLPSASPTPVTTIVPLSSPTPTPNPSTEPSPSATITPAAVAPPIPSPTPASTVRAMRKKPLFVPPKNWDALGPSSKETYDNRYVAGTFVKLDKRSGKVIGGFNVVETPNIGYTLEDFVKLDLINWRRRHANAQIAQSHSYTTCHGQQPAWFLAFNADFYGERMRVQQVFAVNRNHGYIATYAHAVKLPNSPEGLAALNSLCIPPDKPVENLAEVPLVPPAGWSPVDLAPLTKQFKDLFNAWAWFGPLHDTHRSAIFLTTFQTPNMASLSSENLEAELQAGMAMFAKDVKVVSQDPISLCGEDGIHYAMTATERGFPMAIDAVVSAGSPASYAVFYMRRASDSNEPEALISIRSLCPKGRQGAG